MKFAATCPHCQAAFQTEYLDSGIHDLHCPHCGERFVLFIRKHRFEMLFDLGTRALVDGYAREAVVNFAAALERAFEFYLRSALLERFAREHRALDTVTRELDATWKLLVSQSERQLGAFAALYLAREGRAPEFLTPQAMGTDFRNRVIHRGYLPRESEVQEYAARLFALMNRLLEELGDAALQATLMQERDYAAALDALHGDVVAVFEEHPGMFRTPRPQPLPHTPVVATPTPSPNAGRPRTAQPMNDAAAFQAALKERGTLVSELFGGKTGR